MPEQVGIVDAVQQATARLAKRHVGAVVGAIGTGARSSVAAAGRIRAPGEPRPDADTLFEIGSITKVFTGLLLAEAVVRGEVALDTPLRDVLPGTAVPSRDGVEITLEHLATHTSGLPRLPMGPVEALRRTFSDDPYAGIDRAALMAALAGTRLRRTPGTDKVHYSNFGAGVLGHALVVAGGHADYAELVRERICAPLGLTDTVVVPDSGQAARQATGHHRGRPVPPWNLLGMPGAGALRSTATDMLTFLTAQLHPDRSPLGAAIELSQTARPPGRGRLGTGLGWLRTPGPDRGVVLWHNGGTGGFRSFAGLVPGRGVAVVALVNDRRSPDGTAFGLLGQLGRD